MFDCFERCKHPCQKEFDTGVHDHFDQCQMHQKTFAFPMQKWGLGMRPLVVNDSKTDLEGQSVLLSKNIHKLNQEHTI